MGAGARQSFGSQRQGKVACNAPVGAGFARSGIAARNREMRRSELVAVPSFSSRLLREKQVGEGARFGIAPGILNNDKLGTGQRFARAGQVGQ